MRQAAKNHLQIHQMTIGQFEAMFKTEDHCKAYLTANRWPDGVIRCPRCGNDEVNELTKMPFKWECSACAVGHSYRFSVLVGTIFENTNKPLRDWFRVMHLMLTSKKGISALQIYRVMGFGSYNTAHLMCSKIRVALGNVEFKQLVGYVEVDETFVGGKAKNRHRNKRGGPGGTGDAGGTGGHGKTIVIGAVQRKGNVVARVIDNLSAETLGRFVRETVSHKVSLVSTDERRGYNSIDGEFPRSTVDHWAARSFAAKSRQYFGSSKQTIIPPICLPFPDRAGCARALPPILIRTCAGSQNETLAIGWTCAPASSHIPDTSHRATSACCRASTTELCTSHTCLGFA